MSTAGFFLEGPSFCISTGVVGALCWAASLVTVDVTIILSGAVIIFTLNLMYGLFGIFALAQSFPYVLYFLLEEFQTSANCFGPVCESTCDTQQKDYDGYPTVGTGEYGWACSTQSWIKSCLPQV